ncbi:hypothetical protein HZS61_016948 [Fusarium oxysporum f. sp. conglutinans]|uniref:Uncharacterized protein n=1 Tax=Fusarium oxysporum f. sp. conglutinans TaxID=100902 RepID=A0A8H6GI79_FUSOX|nr:hypothetical protein HZS61_016948 [Fusarium oxysporum f. sp. conglutinans]KAG6978086.1 hypothetical protein FocnCong_v021349 [Fusarium oxysporum f. sp. conglutinans]
MLGTKRKVVSQQGEAPQTPKRRSNRNRANDPNEPQLYVERAEIDLVGLEACRRIIAAKYSEEYQAMVAKIMEEKAEPEAQEGLEDDGDGDAEK